jgi:hypothetical protein
MLGGMVGEKDSGSCSGLLWTFYCYSKAFPNFRALALGLVLKISALFGGWAG